MPTIGLGELRHDASGIVRRVEAGERIGITEAGRLAALLVSVARPQWRNSRCNAASARPSGSGQEVADAVAYLLAPAASFVTEAVLPVDGGRAAHGPDPEQT